MNTNLNAIKVLCFGDSNTWGYIPKTAERYPKNIRWTGLLQDKLGNDYEIVEEGLNSRTTNLDDAKKGKNGLTYLIPCLETHNPIDIIILFLGTNDLKERFRREAEQIADGVKELLENIKIYAKNSNSDTPKILLVCPTIVDESVEGTAEKYFGAEAKSRKLPNLYKQIADEYKIPFLDLQEYVQPSKKDGYHFEVETHSKLAELMFQEIMTLQTL